MRSRVLVIVATLAVAGCGSSDEAVGKPMTVVGTEMAFAAPDQVTAGRYEVTFRNEGAEYHELAFTHPAGQVVARTSIPGGEEVVMEVDLEPGTWELGCFEPGHYEAGMHQPLVVTPA
jgi:uncharacterized cupredoxin-like copper-binding protein